MAKESGALGLLLNYESSDSERDSGYTSEEDKKRKNDSSDTYGNHDSCKRRRIDDKQIYEDMVVDSPEKTNTFNRIKQKNTSIFDSNISNPQRQLIPQSSKRTCVIPLPQELTLAGPSHMDDPTKHQGRTRCFAHDVGNWAAIFYLPLETATSSGYGTNSCNSSYDTLTSLVSDVVAVCRRDYNLLLTPATDYHVSLSRTLKLRLHMIQPLAHDVRALLATVVKFPVWLNEFSVYVNDDGTRTFLGLRVLTGHAELAGLVGRLDRVLSHYDLPAFYKDCNLHASIAWISGDHSAVLRSILPHLGECFSDYFSDPADYLRSFHVHHLHFKAGSSVHRLQLRET